MSKLYGETNTFTLTANPGRPRVITKKGDKAIERYVDEDPFDASTRVSHEIQAFYDKNEDRFTVPHRLNDFR